MIEPCALTESRFVRSTQAGAEAKRLREMLKSCAEALRPQMQAAGVATYPAV